MFELIRENQLNLMLLLCGACAILVFLLLLTRFLSRSRKIILTLMEVMAVFLLWFDRLAYVYAGDPGQMGYVMVRLSNFMVFFLTSGVVFGFNLYLNDLLTNEGKLAKVPARLKFTGYISAIGMAMAVVSALTNLYYYFDATNTYHRGKGFLLAYIIPVVCPIVQYTVIRQYKKLFSKLIYVSLVLYIFVPIVCGVVQIFAYGVSIVNMAMVAVSISLYIFTYLDLNNRVVRTHEREISIMQGEQARMQRLYDQTAKAFVSAVEKKDELTKGNAERVANYAKKIAEMSGKNADECVKVYYAALLHDVGLIGIPDAVIKNDEDPDKTDYDVIHTKPLIGNEILSEISEYPYLSDAAHYSHERYDGSGYPEGLKGEEIPEIARIIGVADAYVTMTTPKRYRDAKPNYVAIEALTLGSGTKFDPGFCDILVRILNDENAKSGEGEDAIESEIVCDEYRTTVSGSVPVDYSVAKISFNCSRYGNSDSDFSAPSVILFDSMDRRLHDNAKSIKANKYIEYGELWFDEHSITTIARNIKETIKTSNDNADIDPVNGKYEIVMGRYEDHLRLKMISPRYEKEAIVALTNGSNSAYLVLTGEHCTLTDITYEKTNEKVGPDDIPRIADQISFTDRMESDLPNIQVDRPRSVSTEGVELKDRLRFRFHSMSLPGASFVWHCAYAVIFSSDDGRVNGPNYREYANVKIYGENDGDTEYSTNSIFVKKTDAFPGWDVWKEKCKEGFECELLCKKKDNRIILKTGNLGIETENTTIVKNSPDKIYVSLTGDQVAITDIRIG